MKAETLKAWMGLTGLTEIDIASALKISPDTVRRFLKGKSAHRSTVAAFERLVAEHPANVGKSTAN